MRGLVLEHEARDCSAVHGFFCALPELEKRKLNGDKKARLLVQPGFFRDPVGIRTPNLRIRSAMLYPVELQSRSTLTVR